jgi:hypothetical protein
LPFSLVSSFTFSGFRRLVQAVNLQIRFLDQQSIQKPNDCASAAAHLSPALILAENTKPHSLIRTRRLGGQLQARVGPILLGNRMEIKGHK